MFRRNHFENQCQKAQKCIENEEYVKAREIYIECLSINPEDLGILNNLAQLNYMLGDYGKAEGYNELLLKECDKQLKYGKTERLLKLKSTALFSLNRNKEGNEAIDELLKISPNNQVGLFHKAQYLESKKEYRQALQYINKVLREDPSNIIGLLSKGRLLCQMNEFEESEKCYNRILEIETKNTTVINLKSQLLKRKYDISLTPHDLMLKALDNWKMKDLKAAENYFKKALDMDSQYSEIWFAQGELFIRMGKITKAINSFNKAFELNPKIGGVADKKGFFKMLNRMLKVNKFLGYEKE